MIPNRIREATKEFNRLARNLEKNGYKTLGYDFKSGRTVFRTPPGSAYDEFAYITKQNGKYEFEFQLRKERNALKQIREKKNITQEEMAERTGIDIEKIIQFEIEINNECYPNIEEWKKIEEEYETDCGSVIFQPEYDK